MVHEVLPSYLKEPMISKELKWCSSQLAIIPSSVQRDTIILWARCVGEVRHDSAMWDVVSTRVLELCCWWHRIIKFNWVASHVHLAQPRKLFYPTQMHRRSWLNGKSRVLA